VGLPPGLFYGTGIPACILVINKQGATARDHVLFINADREYREGKNQNSLRAEDIEKITHVYRKRLDVPHYSRNVPCSWTWGRFGPRSSAVTSSTGPCRRSFIAFATERRPRSGPA